MKHLISARKQIIYLLIALLMLVAACVPGSAAPAQESPTPGEDQDIGLANLASVHCEEQGGRVEIRSDAEGSQFGVCVFEDGSECEEWAFYRGECELGRVGTPAASEEPGVADELIGTDWDLIEMTGELLLPGSTITIAFDESAFSGSAGCNHYFGDFTSSGSQLAVGMVGNTEMWCEGLMEQEQAFLSRIIEAVSLTLDEERLTIHTNDGDLIFEPARHQTLEGVDWILGGIARGDAVVETWIDAEIIAVFKDGRISGMSGCNQYFATYETDGTTLTLGPTGGTRMSCDEERNQREAEFLAALAAVTEYRISRDTLTFIDSEGSELLAFRAKSEPKTSDELVGQVWQWLQYEDSAGINDILVDDPPKYTLELLLDGTYQIRADCNQGGGSYQLDGSSLTLMPGPMTMAECGPDSLYSEFVARLGEVVTYVLEDGKLYLNLKMDAGNMVFGLATT